MSGLSHVLARPFAVAILGLFVVAPLALAHDGGIHVTFQDNNRFTVTSDKEISNVIVELCDGTMHKHEPIDEPSYHHQEDQGVIGVWVKAGNNHNEDENAPSGAGERFDNDDVDCDNQPPQPTNPPPTSSEPAPSSPPPEPSEPVATPTTSEPAPSPRPTTTSPPAPPPSPTPTTTAPAPESCSDDLYVMFHSDTRFSVTSCKDISNVIVELCDGTMHKHELNAGRTFDHEESQGVVGVWVKAGDNHNEDASAPPGAGERFDNEGVVCDAPPATTQPPPTSPSQPPGTTEPAPTTPPPTTEPAPTTPPANNGPPPPPPATNPPTTGPSQPPATTTTTSSPNPPATTPPAQTPPPSQTAPDSTNPTPTTPIPVFPSAAAVALAMIGALGGGFLIMRRR